MTQINAYTFNLCAGLERVTLPYSITTIKNNAFTNCTNLTEITIPRRVTAIDDNVFSYPTRLTIYGISGTAAETYANKIGAAFIHKEVKATEAKLNVHELTMIKGTSYTLTLNVTPEDFTDDVDWKTPANSVVTVDSSTIESSSTEESSSTIESSSTEESSAEEEDEWHYPQNKITWTTLSDVHAEIGTIKSKVYDGLPYTPAVKVTITNPDGKKTVLTEGTDSEYDFFYMHRKTD